VFVSYARKHEYVVWEICTSLQCEKFVRVFSVRNLYESLVWEICTSLQCEKFVRVFSVRNLYESLYESLVWEICKANQREREREREKERERNLVEWTERERLAHAHQREREREREKLGRVNREGETGSRTHHANYSNHESSFILFYFIETRLRTQRLLSHFY
jgi:hypothetical protein